MEIQAASPADAEEISSLIVELSTPFYISPTREGAEPFLASISVEPTRSNLCAHNFSYYSARSKSQLAGVVALRDNSHIYHLFVAKQFQRMGVAGQLWSIVKSKALQAGNPGEFTVNSSLNAVPVYEKFGFVRSGGVQRMHGVCFQPMRLQGS